MARIEIIKNNLFYNLDRLAQKVGVNKLSVVLKDNAYGHGLLEIASLCAEYGVRHAVVRTIAEAKAVGSMFDSVLVLADYPCAENADNIAFTANSIEGLNRFVPSSKVHLKIDTGMHRNGIEPDEIEAALDIVCSRSLRLEGVMSHLRSADELSSEYFWQTTNFLNAKSVVLDLCRKKGLPNPIFHLHNSAGVYRCSDFTPFDRVRVGIAMYGYMQMPEAFLVEPLKPVMRLVANKISTRTAAKGSRVGYGGSFELEKESQISCYDIGYADGLLRLNETHDYTLHSGQKLLGRVSMDNFSALGSSDEVCVFEDATALAECYGTITYDVLAKLDAAIPRIVV